MKFSTKAATLHSLKGRVKQSKVLPLYYFTVGEWKLNRKECILKILQQMSPKRMIVRSSCRREDSEQYSNAGAFLSIPDINSGNLEAAIEDVIASYGNAQEDDEVLVQPMLENVLRSGVAFSHDPNTCAPYRVINWSEGGDTAAVTGGIGGRTLQRAALAQAAVPEELVNVLSMLEELLAIFDAQPLDCEFAITGNSQAEEELWLLQVRPLILNEKPQSDQKQANRLSQIETKIQRGMHPHPFVKGRRTVYGVMPDWNPAEIIGIRPKPLALSLYRELITDATWAYQRHNYGYRNLRGHPLMPHFFGLPYIDVRLSFNSFIPVDLNDGIAGRLVDYYIDRLLAEPKLHDKVEFEIVFSCYTLDLPQRLKKLKDAGFSKSEQDEIAHSLRNLTNRVIHTKDGLWRTDAEKLQTLQKRREVLFAEAKDPLERIYWLLEDGKRYGTLPFAGLARAGFIAIQMLKSLVSVGIFSQDDYDSFIGSVSTVGGQLSHDRASMDKSVFLSRYGHLRPGTYDLLSPRYDEAPDLYFNWNEKPHAPKIPKPFSMTVQQMREISDMLASHGLEPDVVGLMDFMQAGIEMREMAKFHFTRNLSDAIALLNDVGSQHNFSREDLAYCDISAFKEMHVAAVDIDELLSTSIEQGKKRHQDSMHLSMPPLIASPADVWSFERHETAPNYITQKQITAPVVNCSDKNALVGSIVCIPNADPGFDWLFSYPIAGLITAWGGVNSHMAIRAGELGLPSVIGVGEDTYRQWSDAKRLHLDCQGQRVERVA